MPEGVNRGRLNIVSRSSPGIADVFITKGDAEATDDHARETRDDGEGDTLPQGIGLGHEDEFTFVAVSRGLTLVFTAPLRSYPQA